MNLENRFESTLIRISFNLAPSVHTCPCVIAFHVMGYSLCEITQQIAQNLAYFLFHFSDLLKNYGNAKIALQWRAGKLTSWQYLLMRRKMSSETARHNRARI